MIIFRRMLRRYVECHYIFYDTRLDIMRLMKPPRVTHYHIAMKIETLRWQACRAGDIASRRRHTGLPPKHYAPDMWALHFCALPCRKALIAERRHFISRLRYWYYAFLISRHRWLRLRLFSLMYWMPRYRAIKSISLPAAIHHITWFRFKRLRRPPSYFNNNIIAIDYCKNGRILRDAEIIIMPSQILHYFWLKLFYLISAYIAFSSYALTEGHKLQ